MTRPSIESVLSHYLFASNKKPSELVDDRLIREELADGEYGSTLLVDALEFMSVGAGRFALPAHHLLIKQFFTALTSILPPTGERQEYTWNEIMSKLNVEMQSPASEYGFNFQQYNYDDGRDNYIERSFIWNSTGFVIDSDARFIVEGNGDRKIENLQVRPYDDNFDYASNNWLASATNSYSQEMTDPSKIGRTVELKMQNVIMLPSKSYSSFDFEQDVAWLLQNGVSNVTASVRFAWNANLFFEKLFDDGVTNFLDVWNRPIAYGTEEADLVNFEDVTDLFNEHNLYKDFSKNGVVYVAGSGADTITFSQGGDFSRSFIDGGLGDDTFILDISMGSKPLVIDGGDGGDTFQVTGGNDQNGSGAVEGAFSPVILFGGEGRDIFDLRGSMNIVLMSLEDTKSLQNVDPRILINNIDLVKSHASTVIIINPEVDDILRWNGTTFGEVVPESYTNKSVGSRYHIDEGLVISGEFESAYGKEVPIVVGTKLLKTDVEQTHFFFTHGEDFSFGTNTTRGIGEYGVNGSATYFEVRHSQTSHSLHLTNFFNGDFGINFREDLSGFKNTTTRHILENDFESSGLPYSYYFSGLSNVLGSFSHPYRMTTNENVSAFTYRTETEVEDAWQPFDERFSKSILRPTIDVPVIGSENADHLIGTMRNDVIFARGGDDVVEGGEGDDYIDGGEGSDLLRGGAGNDILTGGAGADRLEGGSGSDAVSYDGSNAPIKVRLWSVGEGGHAEGDTFDSVEIVIGSQFGDLISGQDHVGERLMGGAGDDELFGFGGADELFGGPGSDYLNGGRGNDYLEGGEGDDWLSGGEGRDAFAFMYGAGQDTVSDLNRLEGDVIVFAGQILFDFEEVLAVTTQVGESVHIRYAPDGELVLLGRSIESLGEADFEFVWL